MNISLWVTPKPTEARLASLNAILPEAQKVADSTGETIHVLWSPIYVNEHSKGEHVYGPEGALATCFKKREGIDWEIDASITRKGVLYNPAVCVARL